VALVVVAVAQRNCPVSSLLGDESLVAAVAGGVVGLLIERRIAYRKLGRYVRFHPDDLAEYVAAHRVQANQYPEVG
jgi:hypothetical protein